MLTAPGCGLFDDDGDAAVTPPEPSTTSTTIPEVTANVVDPGAAPRDVLRIRLTEGDEATVAFTSDLAIDQTVGDRTQRLDSPPITQVLTYTVTDVDETGADLTVHLDDVTINPKGSGLSDDAIDALDAELAAMVGLTGQGHLSEQGQFTEAAFELPDGADQDLATQVDQLTTQMATFGPVLPTEPVGIGATWETTTTAAIGGAAVELTTRTTLTAVDDNSVSYTAALTSNAEPQALDAATLADGTSARLVSSSLTGTSTGTQSLTQPRFELRATMSGPQELVVTGDEGDTTLTQRVEVAYAARPGEH